MTNKQALDIVTMASLEFRGNRKDHEAIAQALDTLSKLIPVEAVPQAKVADNVVDIKS